MKKQVKITKLLRKSAKPPRRVDECDDLEEEVRQLEQKLSETHNDLFQIQRNKYRQKISPTKEKDDVFTRPEKIVLSNSVDNLKNSLELMSMLTGVEVQSYVTGDHCCIVYHMQHSTDKEIKHGLRIDMNSDQNTVTKSSLPVGFNFKAIMEDYDNILMPECLGAVRNGLFAYYDRLEQFDALKKLLKTEAKFFKVLDGSYMEVSFIVQNETEEEDNEVDVTLVLQYRVYDIRPKSYSFKDTELVDGVAEILKEQCAVFKKKPLVKAFKEAFISGVGLYKLAQQLQDVHELSGKRRVRGTKRHYNNDDTFLPEDCSDDGEEGHD